MIIVESRDSAGKVVYYTQTCNGIQFAGRPEGLHDERPFWGTAITGGSEWEGKQAVDILTPCDGSILICYAEER